MHLDSLVRMSRLNKTENGTSIFRCVESGKEIAVFKSMKCLHCGFHWDVIPGSGRKRGWCQNCNGPTCGSPACDPCVHYMQKIDNMEADRDLFFKPIVAHLPFKLLIPTHADNSSEVGLFDAAPHGLDVGVPSHEQRGGEIQAAWPETLDGIATERADVPLLLDAGTGSVGEVPMDAGGVE